MERAGFVLVGGRSSRMGRDKALLPLEGTTLVERAAAQLRRVTSTVALVGAPERYGFLGLPVLADRYPGAGPLAGIQAALAHTEADWNLVVACDMPEIPDALLAGLLYRAGTTSAAACVPLPPGGRPEPLCAAYHRRAEPSAREFLESGRRRMMDWLAVLDVHWVEAAHGNWFRNTNTFSDWEHYLGQSREEPRV